MGNLSLLHGIFPTQELNPGLLHCRQILYQLSHKRSPRILEWVAYPISKGSSWPRNWTRVSYIVGRFFTNWAIKEALFSDSYQGSSLLLDSSKIFKLLKNLRTVDYYVYESNIPSHCDPGKFAALSLELTLFKFSQRRKQLILIVDIWYNYLLKRYWCRFSVIPIKISANNFVGIGKLILKVLWRSKRLRIANIQYSRKRTKSQNSII